MTQMAAGYGMFGAGTQELIEEAAGPSGRSQAVDGHVPENRLASRENGAAELRLSKAFIVPDVH
jgi:hypothetical protein